MPFKLMLLPHGQMILVSGCEPGQIQIQHRVVCSIMSVSCTHRKVIAPLLHGALIPFTPQTLLETMKTHVLPVSKELDISVDLTPEVELTCKIIHFHIFRSEMP